MRRKESCSNTNCSYSKYLLPFPINYCWIDETEQLLCIHFVVFFPFFQDDGLWQQMQSTFNHTFTLELFQTFYDMHNKCTKHTLQKQHFLLQLWELFYFRKLYPKSVLNFISCFINLYSMQCRYLEDIFLDIIVIRETYIFLTWQAKLKDR